MNRRSLLDVDIEAKRCAAYLVDCGLAVHEFEAFALSRRMGPIEETVAETQREREREGEEADE